KGSPSPACLAAARAGMALPRQAGAAKTVAPVPGHQHLVLHVGDQCLHSKVRKPTHAEPFGRVSMIRLTILSAAVLFLALYAWRDWYKSACGLVLLMAVMEHPDMPKTMFDMQGLNPWNLLLTVVLLAWVAQRRREGLVWDMPRHITVLLFGYL